jgi:hypothetical protein
MNLFPLYRAEIKRALLVLSVTLLVVARAHCNWCRRLPACESYRSAEAVFLGQVVASEILSDGSIRTRFAVKEAFKGVSETDVLVISGPDLMLEGSAPPLRTGDEYLVFAGQDAEHRLVARGCGSPMPASLAVGEIRFLHAQRAQDAPKTLLYGTLLRWTGDEHMSALDSTRVDASGPSGSFKTITDSDGYFEFRNIPPGKYQVTPAMPDTLAGAQLEVTIEEGGCAAAPIMAMWNGRISGHAARSDGQPVSEANVTLIDLARDRGEGIAERTDAEGHYEFGHLEPGHYVIGLLDIDSPSDDYPFPPLFYPNAVSPDLATILDSGKARSSTMWILSSRISNVAPCVSRYSGPTDDLQPVLTFSLSMSRATVGKRDAFFRISLPTATVVSCSMRMGGVEYACTRWQSAGPTQTRSASSKS